MENEVMCFNKIIDEVRYITAEQVAKKQDAAKLNFPNIIEKIKEAAALGKSNLNVPESQMNQYDIQLLKAEGFSVILVDLQRDRYDDIYNAIGQYKPVDKKQWNVTW